MEFKTLHLTILTLDNTTGGDVNRYTVYSSTNQPSETFGKSSGLGEPVIVCDPAPLEIGNYVWCDSIVNGLQDACETGIVGVTVQLFDSNGLLVGQTVTNANGQYYFNQFNVDNTGINANGTPVTGFTGLDYATQYYIVFGDGQYSGGQLVTAGDTYFGVTSVNAGANDNIDSDVDGNVLSSGSIGAIPNGLPFINMVTSETGCGDHKYDLGLLCNCPSPNLSLIHI